MSSRHYCSPVCQQTHRRLRPQATRYEPRWTDSLKDAGEVLLGLLVLLALFIGLPFLLWLVAA